MSLCMICTCSMCRSNRALEFPSHALVWYSSPLLIRTPLLSIINYALIREVSFGESDHYMHSQYLLPRLVSFLEGWLLQRLFFKRGTSVVTCCFCFVAMCTKLDLPLRYIDLKQEWPLNLSFSHSRSFPVVQLDSWCRCSDKRGG